LSKKLRELPRRSGHPRCGWKEAQRIITQAFNKHGHSDFTLRESNFYATSHEASEYQGMLEQFDSEKALEIKLEDILEGNQNTLRIIVEKFFEKACEMHYGSFFSTIFPREDIKHMFEEILERYHSFPEIERTKTAKMLSFEGLKLLFEIGRHVIGIRMRMPYQLPKNENYREIVEKYRRGHNQEIILTVVREVMSEYSAENGFQEGDFHYEYEPIPKVNYTFQEKFGVTEEGETVIANLGIDDLRQEENWHYLAEFHDLAKKLLIFGVLGYRLYNETGVLLDLRPEKNVLTNLLLNGEYGFSTGNVRILLKINKYGEKETVVKILDNKDQFQASRKGRKYPGLAKTGFGMAGWIGKQAWERFIGKCVDAIWKNETMEKEFEIKLGDYCSNWGQLLNEWLEVVSQHVCDDLYKKLVESGADLIAQAGSFARNDEVYKQLVGLCKEKVGSRFPSLCGDLISEICRASILKTQKAVPKGPTW